jgi:hypothetical protein
LFHLCHLLECIPNYTIFGMYVATRVQRISQGAPE